MSTFSRASYIRCIFLIGRRKAGGNGLGIVFEMEEMEETLIKRLNEVAQPPASSLSKWTRWKTIS